MRRSKLLLVGFNNLSVICLKSLFTDSLFTVIGDISHIARIEVGALPDPDVALVENTAEIETVLAALKHLDEIYPATPVVILNDKVCAVTLATCLAAGASGFLTKDISADVLRKSLQLVVMGETVFPTDLAGFLVGSVRQRQPSHDPEDNPCGLSCREMETVQCLVRGESNKMIARRLRITEATIKVHMKSVMRKIKASNRTQAAIWAHRNGHTQACESGLLNEGGGQFYSNESL